MPLVYQPQLLTWFRSLCSPLPQWGFRRRLLFRGHDPTAKHMHQNMLRKNKEKYTEYTVANSLRPSDAYLCVNKPTIIWANAGILLIGPLGRNFCDMLIEIHIPPIKKMHSKMTSTKRGPSCLGLNALTHWPRRCGCNLELVICKSISRIEILGISCEIALRWIPQDLVDY